MISVVIPAYNSVKSIGRAIDSVLAQTYADYEIIVIDDGSTDGTGELVRKYGEQVRYQYEDNAGVCVARNAGVELAKGEWIAFLDHDDYWEPGKLARQVEIVERNPQLRWCSTNYNQDDGQMCAAVMAPGKISTALGDSDYFESFFLAAGRRIIRIMPTTTMIRTDVYRQVGGFDATLRRSEDTDLWCRIALRYPAIGFAAEALATRYLNTGVGEDVIRLRLEQKTGGPMRKVLARYFDAAREAGRLDDYRVFARMEIERILAMCVFNGLPEHARTTVRQFRELFKWHQRSGVYLLTVFPGATSAVLRFAAYMGQVLHLERQASRRRLYPKRSAKKADG